MKPDPLLLLHGLNNTPAVWAGVAAHWRHDSALITPTLPTLADMDALAQSLLDDLPGRFWLAGHSFGGYVALAILARAPERIAGLAMICSTPQADSAAQSLARRSAILTMASEAARGEMAAGYVERTLAQGTGAFHPQNRDDATLRQRRREMAEDYGPCRYVAHMLASLARPDRSALVQVPQPLLWVAGSDDPLYPPQAMQAMQTGAGHGAMQVIGPAGHLLPLEQPKALADVLSAWIGR